jgi:CheY-like chemotaxis protein
MADATRAAAGAAGQRAVRGTPTMSGAPRPLVVIIEDDAVTRELLHEALEDAGYRTQALATGTHAVERIRALHPAVVILDLWLDAVDSGWWVVEQLQRDGQLQQLPVIVCSGNAFMLATLAEVRPRPHYVYLPKPVPLDALLAHLQRLIDRAPAD